MKIEFHRKEQWDLECWPWLAAHLKTPNRSKRIFCIWNRGIQLGSFMITSKMIRFGRRIYKF